MTGNATPMRSPLVSIVVPCYMQAHFLSVALASVQAQTFTDWECIIIDDGSPDDTAEVAKRWTASDVRFQYHYKKNGGLSSARNLGLSIARGHYIQFLDSDDVILPSKLELQVSQLSETSKHSLAFCDYSRGSAPDIYTLPARVPPYLPPVVDEVPSVLELGADWETRISIPAHCFLFSRVFFDEGIHFDESLVNHEDWDCWMQIFRLTLDVKYCQEKLAIYRYSQTSMTANLVSMRDGFLTAIDKQIHMNADNRALLVILRLKRSEMDLVYRNKIRTQSPLIQHVFFFARDFYCKFQKQK